MAAQKKQLLIYLDETFRHTFQYKDASGNPISVLGCTGRMEIRSVLDPNNVYLILTTDNGRLSVDDGALGYVDVLIPHTDVDETKILWQEGNYDLKLTFPDGSVDTIVYGKMVVQKNVTRV